MAAPRTPRRAVVPAAGLGTRMYPAAKALPKELFPFVTPDGRCLCLLQRILEEAAEAGAEEILLVVRPGDLGAFQDFLAPLRPEVASRLPGTALADCRRLEEIGRRVGFALQTEPLGFGHAVLQARRWCADEPFLLMLPDHIYESETDLSCARQLIRAWRRLPAGASVASLHPVPLGQVRHYGACSGTWLDPANTVCRLTEFAEKPDPEYAAGHLRMPGLPEDRRLCVHGQYVLSPEIFDVLERQVRDGRRVRGEFQLATALQELTAAGRLYGYAVRGRHHDTGHPAAYLRSLCDFGKAAAQTEA